MRSIKKGDIVSRNSYNNDILFFVERIDVVDNRARVAVLKGITIRIEADSPIEDLTIVPKRIGENELRNINRAEDIERIDNRLSVKLGKILHLDGDRRYSEKTERYYRKRNLNFVVKHVSEYRQPQIIRDLLRRYRPDIVVFTGHDGLIKSGKNYDDINNYRTSKYFVNAVKEARMWNPNINELVIFAGACQSYYEAIISAGANFASSPARILIDFVDPLIVADTVATSNQNRLVTMNDLERKIRNGRMAISGIGATGKSTVI